jgi:asparagine synthase (glutamine-hydrolysing)
MCGICGIFEPGATAPVELSTLSAMADSIRHRGPDDDGYYTEDGLGLAFRRLSIIDLAGGHQPLCNEDESIWTVFNGEIYNFRDLNKWLVSRGHSFKTRSDTETIVHLYEEMGEACFAELRGMFAIALWDGRRKKLLLARDRIGKKPLYYSWDGRRLVFGSEIKAMWPAGAISSEMDLEALSDYFSYQYIPAPKTIYRDIRKVRPAHYLEVRGSTIREVPYWDIHFNQTRELSEDEWCERLMEEYATAVQSRLVSDVPLGAFLSAGVDSSSVVALMDRFQRPVTTCSIGFRVDGYDEAADARKFATNLGTKHFEHFVETHAIDLISKLAWHFDEPFADSSAIPTYYVSRMAREHVTVALSGDGGDESFAGYRRYRFDLWENHVRSLFPEPFRRNVFGPLGQVYPKLGWAPRIFRAKSTLQSLARDPLEGYFYGLSICPPNQKSQLFSPELHSLLAGYDSSDVLRFHYDRADTTDPLSRIQYVDMKTYLTDDILVKVDRASMANSLEVRCPLLDHKFMEMAAQIPSRLKLHNGQSKYILKKALRGVVSSDILNRRKRGFAAPVAEWFRGELKEHTHDRIFSNPDGILNQKYLTECWRQHQRGQRDWSALLWCVLMFKTWQEVCKPA